MTNLFLSRKNRSLLLILRIGIAGADVVAQFVVDQLVLGVAWHHFQRLWLGLFIALDGDLLCLLMLGTDERLFQPQNALKWIKWKYEMLHIQAIYFLQEVSARKVCTNLYCDHNIRLSVKKFLNFDLTTKQRPLSTDCTSSRVQSNFEIYNILLLLFISRRKRRKVL